MNLGVIIGRFQTSELHDGHRKLIQHVQSQHQQVLILLGVTEVVGSKRNPLDFGTRAKMLVEKFPEVLLAPIPDMPTDELWSQNLDSLVKLISPIGKITLYGGRDSFIPHYKGKHKTVEVEIGHTLSGTDVRTLASNKILVSSDFRAGIIYAIANQYQRVFPCVDIAIIKGDKVVLGSKKNENLLRFPGGFVDQEDGTLENAARREALEETGIRCLDLEYVCSNMNEDWRYRHKDDGLIMTSLFMTKTYTENPVANDDLSSVGWYKISNELLEKLTPCHRNLMQALINKINKDSNE